MQEQIAKQFVLLSFYTQKPIENIEKSQQKDNLNICFCVNTHLSIIARL